MWNGQKNCVHMDWCTRYAPRQSFLTFCLSLAVLTIHQCHWSDGRVYTGDWENGKAHGYGKEVRPDGSIRHDGKWEMDKPIRNFS